MSEYYCSHQPPCCPQLDTLKADIEKHIDKVRLEIGRRTLAEGKVFDLEAERDRLTAELKKANEVLVKNHYAANNYIHERDRWKGIAEKAREALKSIVDYGEALQPNPVHHVTFNACVIAREALALFEKEAK